MLLSADMLNLWAMLGGSLKSKPLSAGALNMLSVFGYFRASPGWTPKGPTFLSWLSHLSKCASLCCDVDNAKYDAWFTALQEGSLENEGGKVRIRGENGGHKPVYKAIEQQKTKEKQWTNHVFNNFERMTGRHFNVNSRSTLFSGKTRGSFAKG